MSTPDKLFTKLLFTKLDLNHAYQQVVLDEKSQPYVTINTGTYTGTLDYHLGWQLRLQYSSRPSTKC